MSPSTHNPTALDPIADRYLRNIAALWSADPRLAVALERLADDQRLTTEPSKAGPPTARVSGGDGVARYLHSRYDPEREAATIVEANLRDVDAPVAGPSALDCAAEQDDRSANPDSALRTSHAALDSSPLCYVLFGLGLGYVARRLLDQLPQDAIVLAVEPELATLVTALELHDFSADLALRRLGFVTTRDINLLHERLRPHTLAICAGVRMINSPAADALAPEFHAALRQAVTDFVSYTRMAMLTLLMNAETTYRNVSHNLSHYVTSPPLSIVKNRFAGVPAVVVAAGPSLAARLPTLKKMAGRCVIIAVQTALRPLLEAGITPTFATTLDYNEISQRYFQDLPAELADVHLVAEPKANWHILDTFVRVAARDGKPAMLSLLGNDFADNLLGDALPLHKHRLPAGATVAHLAFYLAQHLGCDPIIFVGQDLGFSNGTYYTPGTAIHRAWAGEMNRYNSVESMEWQRIVRHRTVLRKLRDVHGRPIYTDEQMYTYLQQFERDFAAAPQRIIDATGGGVAKRGAQEMNLDEAAERYARDPLPADALAYRDRVPWHDVLRLPQAHAVVRDRIDEAKQLRDVCDRTLDLLVTLADLLETDPAQFNRTMVQVDELRLWVTQHAQTYSLVSLVSQAAEFRRHGADRSLRIAGAQGIAKRKFQLARDRAYVREMRAGCDRLLKILDSTLERLNAQGS